MRNIKAQMAVDLFDMLYEANNADADHDENDLHYSASYQDNLYGDLSKAIKSLGYKDELNTWVETGDRPNLKDLT